MEMYPSEICAMLPMKGSGTYAERTHVQKKKTALWMYTMSCSIINKRRKTCNEIEMLRLATLCSHSVSETFHCNDGKGSIGFRLLFV
jgi:hypothetical protein